MKSSLMSLAFVSALLIAFPAQATVLPSVSSGTLKLHLDAGVGVTTEVGNRVTFWDDQAPSGANDFSAPSLSPRRPTLIPNGLNGGPTIRFDGATNWLNVVGGHNLTSGGSTLDDAFTFFVVRSGGIDPFALFDSAPSTADVFRFAHFSGANPNNPAFAVELWNGNPAIHNFAVDPLGSVVSVVGRSVPNRFLDVVETAMSGGFTATASTASSTPVAWTNPNIGSINAGGNGFFGGDIAEIVLYEGELNAADRAAVTQALAVSHGFLIVPEPSSLVLAVCGVGGAIGWRRRRMTH